MQDLKKMIPTMSGMWALWDYEQYKDIDSYEKWEELLLKDDTILQQIELSKFVPIYIHIDGAYLFEIKINKPLNERENKYVFKKSEEYLLNSTGTVVLSGIENVSGDVRDDEGIKFDLEDGLYSVEINMIEWDAEPNMKLENGDAAPDALPDFIVCINKVEDSDKIYRKSIETFNQ